MWRTARFFAPSVAFKSDTPSSPRFTVRSKDSAGNFREYSIPPARASTSPPDAGYHNAPLDYVVDELVITIGPLYLGEGVAIGTKGAAFGLEIQTGGTDCRLLSSGTVKSRNQPDIRFVRIPWPE